MSETADVANNLPIIILFSFWWAFLSMLDVLSEQNRRTTTSTDGRRVEESTAIGADCNFPELSEIDPEFSTAVFMRGACRAYEEVLRAYALCDTKTLRALVSEDVLRAFTEAFTARVTREETLELTFVGVVSSEIASVEVRSDAVEISVLFHAQVIQAERSSKGEVIRGNPGDVAVVADLWTFSRTRTANTPGWIIIATDEPVTTA